MAFNSSNKYSTDKVLVVVNGTASDDRVVNQASRLISPRKGRLFLLYVIRVERSLPIDAEINEAIQQAERTLKHCEEIVKTFSHNCTAQMLQARDIGTAVVQEGATQEVEAIVLGSLYTSEFGKFRLSADIEYVLANAPCEVILWRGSVSDDEPTK